MTVHNAYPELPEIPYVRTTVSMTDVVAHIARASVSVHIKRAAYVIFRNESGGGQSGINDNYIGLQADGDRQPAEWTHFFVGTCLKNENMTEDLRRFLCFRVWTDCADIVIAKVGQRGLYVGGVAHPYAGNFPINTIDDWPTGYYKEWVKGNAHAVIPDDDKRDLLRQYRDAVRLFPDGIFARMWGATRRIFSPD